MRTRRAHLLTLGLAAALGCGDAGLDAALDDGVFAWGPAGEPRPDVRQVDDMVGDWILCGEPSCTNVLGTGYRLHAAGVGRVLKPSLDDRRRLHRCVDDRPAGLLWTYDQGVLTMRIDPHAPPIKKSTRSSGPATFSVDQYGNTVRWTVVPSRGDSRLLPSGLDTRGALTADRIVPLRAVRLPTPDHDESCGGDVF